MEYSPTRQQTMYPSDQITVRLYPIWTIWMGRILLYLALMFAPIMVVEASFPLLPAAFKDIGKVILNGFAVPILHVVLYVVLHRMKARSQNFIVLVALFYGAIGIAEIQRAFTIGGIYHWAGAVLCPLYALGFTWLLYKGHVANQKFLESGYQAEREAQIDIQTSAILRAQQIQRHLDTAEKAS